ncbi:MAG: glycosyltransferase [Saprospiraceae bacterium]|nr:glycosyltransferase [Saprospiraceae bacterium]
MKYIFENKQGLTHARLLGIKNSNSEYLVFLDDDNFVAVNFINEALRVFNEFPWIGSFSGQIDLKFEHVPPAWTKKYWNLLAFRKFNGNHWSNVYFDNNCMPCGAGLCVRRSVAEKYSETHYNGPRSIILDRTKGSLLSGGDNDLAMCAIDLGMGVGIFESLKLSHYIPRFRTEIEYLKQLAYNIYFSSVILKYVRGYGVERIKFKTLFKRIILLITLPSCDRIIQFSCLRGELDAYKFINPK